MHLTMSHRNGLTGGGIATSSGFLDKDTPFLLPLTPHIFMYELTEHKSQHCLVFLTHLPLSYRNGSTSFPQLSGIIYLHMLSGVRR